MDVLFVVRSMQYAGKRFAVHGAKGRSREFLNPKTMNFSE